MWQMLVNPSYWEKTFHGLATGSKDEADDSAVSDAGAAQATEGGTP
jgi:glycosyltransferase XagB